MRVRMHFLAAIALAAAISLTACGGDDDEDDDADRLPAEAWVADLCDLALRYEDRADELGRAFEAIDFEGAGAKDEVIDLLRDLVDDQERLVDDIEAMGEPDVDDGDRVRDAVRANLQKGSENADTIIEKLEEVDEDELVEQIIPIFESVENPDLKAALEGAGPGGEAIIELIEDDTECEPIAFDN